MLGRLTWAAIPFNEPLPLITAAVVVVVILAVLALITVKGWWPYLWSEWLTSVDHKRIGVMYVIAGAGHAAARLFRRDHDAHAAGDRRSATPRDTCRPTTTTRSSRRTARS